MKNDGLVLRSVGDGDVEQLEVWLNKEHVLKWYHDADEWLYEIWERDGEFAFLNHFIVLVDGTPVGFGQYYDCFDAKEEWYAAGAADEMFSIDYFIGEEGYLGKGYGKAIVAALVGMIRQRRPEAKIVVQPEPENIASGRALLANGFVFDETAGYYIMTA